MQRVIPTLPWCRWTAAAVVPFAGLLVLFGWSSGGWSGLVAPAALLFFIRYLGGLVTGFDDDLWVSMMQRRFARDASG